MKSTKVISVSDIKTEKVRTDGKVSRQYITVAMGNSENPFDTKTYIRNIFQRHFLKQGGNLENPKDYENTWGGLDTKAVKSLVGKNIEGAYIVSKNVEEYTIGANQVNIFSTFILPGENEVSVFKGLGHTIVESTNQSSQRVVAEEPITA